MGGERLCASSNVACGVGVVQGGEQGFIAMAEVVTMAEIDADAFLNLLHGSNPVCSELKRNFSQRTKKNDSFFPLHLYCSLVSNIHVIVSMICVFVFGDLIHCTAMFQ